MERKKGSFILNNSRDTFTGRAKAVHVISTTIFNVLNDTSTKTKDNYIASPDGELAAGTVIAARNGALFNTIQLTNGVIEIIF